MAKYKTRAEIRQNARTDRAIARAPEFDEQAARTEASTLAIMARPTNDVPIAYQPRARDAVTDANLATARRANEIRMDFYDY